MNAGTFIALLAVLLLVGFAVRSIIKDKREGKASCGCSIGGCSGCSGCAACASRGNCGKKA